MNRTELRTLEEERRLLTIRETLEAFMCADWRNTRAYWARIDELDAQISKLRRIYHAMRGKARAVFRRPKTQLERAQQFVRDNQPGVVDVLHVRNPKLIGFFCYLGARICDGTATPRQKWRWKEIYKNNAPSTQLAFVEF